MGRYEEGKSPERPMMESVDSPPPKRCKFQKNSSTDDNYSMYIIISNICHAYMVLIDGVRFQPRSPYCPHPHSCIFYSLQVLFCIHPSYAEKSFVIINMIAILFFVGFGKNVGRGLRCSIGTTIGTFCEKNSTKTFHFIQNIFFG